jgi:hypothetical protein
VRIRRFSRGRASPSPWVWPQSTVIRRSGRVSAASSSSAPIAPHVKPGSQSSFEIFPSCQHASASGGTCVRTRTSGCDSSAATSDGRRSRGGLVPELPELPAEGRLVLPAAEEVEGVPPGGLADVPQVGDDDVVVEDHLGAGEVAEPRVAPAAVADQRRRARQGDDAGLRQPAEGLAPEAPRRLAHRGDVAAVVVVVPEDEVNGNVQPRVEEADPRDETPRLRRVAAEEHRLGSRLADPRAEAVRGGRLDEVQVEVRGPGDAHGQIVANCPANPPRTAAPPRRRRRRSRSARPPRPSRRSRPRRRSRSSPRPRARRSPARGGACWRPRPARS